MTTHTIEVTDIDEDLLRRLDAGAHQQGQDRLDYARTLLRRALDEEEITEFINAQTHESRRKTMAEILDPIHESVRQSGLTPEEVNALLDDTLAEVRRERQLATG